MHLLTANHYTVRSENHELTRDGATAAEHSYRCSVVVTAKGCGRPREPPTVLVHLPGAVVGDEGLVRHFATLLCEAGAQLADGDLAWYRARFAAGDAFAVLRGAATADNQLVSGAWLIKQNRLRLPLARPCSSCPLSDATTVILPREHGGMVDEHFRQPVAPCARQAIFTKGTRPLTDLTEGGFRPPTPKGCQLM